MTVESRIFEKNSRPLLGNCTVNMFPQESTPNNRGAVGRGVFCVARAEATQQGPKGKVSHSLHKGGFEYLHHSPASPTR
jgi:hypothetical protein